MITFLLFIQEELVDIGHLHRLTAVWLWNTVNKKENNADRQTDRQWKNKNKNENEKKEEKLSIVPIKSSSVSRNDLHALPPQAIHHIRNVRR